LQQRFIDKIFTSNDLPTIVLIGGIHGNEQSGVRAIESVFAEIKEGNMFVSGNIYGIYGNLQALQSGERFISEDLNRMWTPKKIKQCLTGKHKGAEADELIEINGVLIDIFEKHKDCTIVDLHTTSSESSPFSIIDDTLRNRKMALQIPATVVLGVMETLRGTLVSHFASDQCKTIVFEAGKHDSNSSVERHKAAIYILLSSLGIVKVNDDLLREKKQLCRLASKHQPKAVSTNLRYEIDDANAFTMLPGFSNFTPVKKGELLAEYKGKPVNSPSKSLVFMPLYQNKGGEGFFIVSKISRFWMLISKLLRQVNADRFIHLFPGVSRLPSDKNRYQINTEVAFFKPLEVMHLLGYRKERKLGKQLILSKRI